MAGIGNFPDCKNHPCPQDGLLDRPAAAARARAIVWRLMSDAVQEHPGRTMTLADLSDSVTRSAARMMGMLEDDLAQLLREHRPH